jgi:hypothetical protein
MKELKEQLKQKENSFKELREAGCVSSHVMGNLQHQIGALRIEIAEINLQEAKDNFKPFTTIN